jgi:leader peptidase (prepilin peptidase)/N-methyltransferase
MIRIFGTIFAGLLGLAFGSFLNVCLSRWPEGESVVQPRSHCRSCDHTLAWWENIPLFSWLALRGRCRGCHSWIGARYPAVEFAVGALWAYSAWQFPLWGLAPEAPVGLLYSWLAVALWKMIFYWILVALAVLDAENLWLPNWITLPGIFMGFVFTTAIANPIFRLHAGGVGFWARIAGISLLSIAAAASLILLIRWVYWLIRRREGIGLGDAKLMALLAAWLGLPGALLSFGLGVVLGAVLALVLLAIPSNRNSMDGWAFTKLPLGSFLCIGGIVCGLWGQEIIAAYLRWTGF